MKQRAFFAIFFLLALVLPVSADPAPTTKDELVFVGTSDSAPYSFYEEDEPAGFSVDLAKILSATMNKDVVIKLMPLRDCLSQIKEGSAEGLIGGPINSEWEKFLDFSEPVSELEYAIFVEASNSYVHSLESLEGTVVAIRKTSIIKDRLSRKDYRLTLLETDSVEECLAKLVNREVTAIIGEKSIVLYYIQRDKIENVKIVGPPLEIFPYAVAVRHDKTELLSGINRAISNIRDNGTLSELQRKWLGLRLIEPFPWRMFFLATTGITMVLLFFATVLWVVSLNATVKAKTQQIQIMSQKMIEKDKLAVLGKLAGQIAHELRTPLSIINNSVFLLRKEGALDQDLFEKRLRILEEKIKLSSNILESILSYSRVKAEVASMISVKECVDEVLKDLQIPEGIQKKVACEDAALSVFMDFHQLYSVIRNIALNAVQAMGETGVLGIKVAPADGGSMAAIYISDTGGGIGESARQKIFSLFYSTKITGTGLGLPISKSIIEANGGSLYLEETNEKGSTFTIKLPSARSGKK